MVAYTLIVTNSHVFAADEDYSCTVVITGDKEEIKAGESVTYEIKATEINAAEGGIEGFETTIEYDSEVFSCKVDTAEDGKWMKTGMLENYLTMYRTDLLPNSEDQVIALVTFTAKADASAGEKSISFTKMKFTMGDSNSLSVDDKPITINIVGNQSADDEEKQNPDDNNEEPTNNDNPDNAVVDNGDSDDDGIQITSEAIEQPATIENQNASNMILPYTGIGITIAVFVIAGVFISILFFKKYRYWKDV